ncbi:MAG: thiamine-phosphate kinase [Candidatus Aminicenantes bacterium]|nr:thiamine-phosphate kinase [Candidatus Aminicenantes bacterium]
MKLSDLGEFGLIARFAPPFLKGLGRSVTGIGDDCAVLPWTKRAALLVTTDMLLEGVHFLRATISASDLGAKSLAVNLSDVAAMAGTPRSAFLSLALPADIGLDWVDGFFRGLRRLARVHGVSLLGGDTTHSKGPIVVNIAVLGTAAPGAIRFRSTARVGDIIAVTGVLGDSGAGLRVLTEGLPIGRDERPLVAAHRRPRAHLAEGAWLGRRPCVRALMDVSDGIDSDLKRILEASRRGAALDLEKLPLSPSLFAVCREHGWKPLDFALSGGEDYCLLTTVAPDAFGPVAAAFRRRFGRPLFEIGRVTDRKGVLAYRLHGRPKEIRRRGYDHFKRHEARR